MLPKLKSLTNVLVLCCAGQMMGCNPVFADTEVTGFAYNTHFGDQHWQSDRNVLAINVDNMNDYLDTRAQFTNNEYAAIRRATIGKTIHITGGTHLTLQAGRMSRVDSFFNNLVDSPAASGMAVLPMGGYNYRMLQGSFSIADGWKADLQGHLGDHLIHGHWTHGYMTVMDQMNYQQEVLKKQVQGIQLNSMIGDTWELHHEFGNFHEYISRTLYGATTELTQSNATSRYYATNAAKALYDLNKYGIRYDDDNFFAMAEYSSGYSHTYSQSGQKTSITDAWDQSGTVGVYFGDRWSAYIGQSYGRNLTAHTEARDDYFGVTKRWDRLTISADYHDGKSQAWMKYDAVAPYEWKSMVVSTTYQF